MSDQIEPSSTVMNSESDQCSIEKNFSAALRPLDEMETGDTRPELAKLKSSLCDLQKMEEKGAASATAIQKNLLSMDRTPLGSITNVRMDAGEKLGDNQGSATNIHTQIPQNRPTLPASDSKKVLLLSKTLYESEDIFEEAVGEQSDFTDRSGIQPASSSTLKLPTCLKGARHESLLEPQRRSLSRERKDLTSDSPSKAPRLENKSPTFKSHLHTPSTWETSPGRRSSKSKDLQMSPTTLRLSRPSGRSREQPEVYRSGSRSAETRKQKVPVATNQMLPPTTAEKTATNQVLPPAIAKKTATNQMLPSAIAKKTETNQMLPPALAKKTATNQMLPPAIAKKTATNQMLPPASGSTRKPSLLVSVKAKLTTIKKSMSRFSGLFRPAKMAERGDRPQPSGLLSQAKVGTKGIPPVKSSASRESTASKGSSAYTSSTSSCSSTGSKKSLRTQRTQNPTPQHPVLGKARTNQKAVFATGAGAAPLTKSSDKSKKLKPKYSVAVSHQYPRHYVFPGSPLPGSAFTKHDVKTKLSSTKRIYEEYPKIQITIRSREVGQFSSQNPKTSSTKPAEKQTTQSSKVAPAKQTRSPKDGARSPSPSKPTLNGEKATTIESSKAQTSSRQQTENVTNFNHEILTGMIKASPEKSPLKFEKSTSSNEKSPRASNDDQNRTTPATSSPKTEAAPFDKSFLGEAFGNTVNPAGTASSATNVLAVARGTQACKGETNPTTADGSDNSQAERDTSSMAEAGIETGDFQVII